MQNKTQNYKPPKAVNNGNAAIATTKHTGKMKTIITTVRYETDHTHSYLKLNEHKILNAFERLAAILRMAKSSSDAYTRISEWHRDINLGVAQAQLDIFHEHRLEREKSLPVMDEFTINTPDDYTMQFEVSHPVGLSITQLIMAVDKELNAIEKLFMCGALDDLEYAEACRQAAAIVTGVTSRIMKVTSPGKRKGGQFYPRYYLEFLRDPHFNMLSLCGIPHDIAKTILTDEQLALLDKANNEDSENKVA
ncbi:hypothetical protein [Pseudoalteromonas sp. Angola-18]|jgi:hypothetical protein|uniref:hypothetical protein n=1 Tax=Pseudoalteromonas sp. Angola-18 TaxID=3025338 RepID=UPI00235925D4|nr:hypothetical protein [Pseudoalteromonas sp. Angola-18]MDC9502950.1 hypothetical protein [Pseudoalteromonas sp. Angola-18]